jgi:hypothetical protein
LPARGRVSAAFAIPSRAGHSLERATPERSGAAGARPRAPDAGALRRRWRAPERSGALQRLPRLPRSARKSLFHRWRPLRTCSARLAHPMHTRSLSQVRSSPRPRGRDPSPSSMCGSMKPGEGR